MDYLITVRNERFERFFRKGRLTDENNPQLSDLQLIPSQANKSPMGMHAGALHASPQPAADRAMWNIPARAFHHSAESSIIAGR